MLSVVDLEKIISSLFNKGKTTLRESSAAVIVFPAFFILKCCCVAL